MHSTAPVTDAVADADATTESRRIDTRASRHTSTVCNNTPRDFEGTTSNVGGVLALRSENVTKKVNCDVFL